MTDELDPDLEAWLAPHLEELTEDLARAVRRCLSGVRPAQSAPAGDSSGASSTLPGRMAEAAVRELVDVLEHSGDREAAVRLLAADASLTYAFQAAAELDVDIPTLSDAVGVRGKLGRHLEERAEDPGRGGSGK